MDGITIVSGGQTGVDRAALDTAMARGLPVDGWCPAGRRAEDGPISARYPLRETPLRQYRQRTEWNVRDSDATLVLTAGGVSPGTQATIAAAHALGSQVMHVRAKATTSAGTVAEWILKLRIRRLNVAGPRESEAPGVYGDACRFMNALMDCLRDQAGTE